MVCCGYRYFNHLLQLPSKTHAFFINLCNLCVLPTQMEKPSVKFRTPSQASTKSSGVESDLNESLNTTRHRFLTAPEVPISDAEAKKRVSELQLEKIHQDCSINQRSECSFSNPVNLVLTSYILTSCDSCQESCSL